VPDELVAAVVEAAETHPYQYLRCTACFDEGIIIIQFGSTYADCVCPCCDW
jgi:hypothetical protein